VAESDAADYFEDGSEDLEEEEDNANELFEDESAKEEDEQTASYRATLTPEVMEKTLDNMRATGIIV
jgi:hypothetical protein